MLYANKIYFVHCLDLLAHARGGEGGALSEASKSEP